MKHDFHFESRRILLRPLEYGDIESLRELRNRNSEFFFDTGHIDRNSQIKWYERYLTKTDDVMFAVELKSSPGVFAGSVALYDIDREKGICEFGRTLIDKEVAAEKGIGTEAAAAVAVLGFDILKLNKIICYAWESNERISLVYRRVGFNIVGEAKEGVLYFELFPEKLNRELISGSEV